MSNNTTYTSSITSSSMDIDNNNNGDNIDSNTNNTNNTNNSNNTSSNIINTNSSSDQLAGRGNDDHNRTKEDYDRAYAENESMLNEWEVLVTTDIRLAHDDITKDIIAKHSYYKKKLQENISWMAKYIKNDQQRTR